MTFGGVGFSMFAQKTVIPGMILPFPPNQTYKLVIDKCKM